MDSVKELHENTVYTEKKGHMKYSLLLSNLSEEQICNTVRRKPQKQVLYP